MSMPYFDALSFRQHQEWPDCTAWCRKRFGYCVLDYAHSGRVSFSMDGSRRRILEGPVAWWTWPGPLFSFGALRGDSWHHHFVSFEGPRAERMVETGLLPARPDPWARPRRPEDFRARMLELFACLESPQPRPELAVHLLEGLLLELGEPAPVAEDDEAGAALDALAAAMRRDLAGAPDLGAWSERAGVSAVHFRRRFRERFGAPPGQYLQALRLEAAAERLRGGRGAVKEIAAEVGVADVLYFTRLFRRRFGLPPAAYGRMHRELA